MTIYIYFFIFFRSLSFNDFNLCELMFTFVCVTILIVHLNELCSISIARLIKSYLIKFSHEIELFAVCLTKVRVCFGKVEECFWHIYISWYAIGVCLCGYSLHIEKCIEMLVCVCDFPQNVVPIQFIVCCRRWHACSKIMGFGFTASWEKQSTVITSPSLSFIISR